MSALNLMIITMFAFGVNLGKDLSRLARGQGRYAWTMTGDYIVCMDHYAYGNGAPPVNSAISMRAIGFPSAEIAYAFEKTEFTVSPSTGSFTRLSAFVFNFQRFPHVKLMAFLYG